MSNLRSYLPKPYYETCLGAAYLGDAQSLLRLLPDESVNLVMTSPPFALQRKKEYGNVPPNQYVSWFLPFADQFWRILRKDGSLVVDIGSSWVRGKPVKTLYLYELLLMLCRKFYLAQDFYWYNPARLPTPAEWVTVRRIRVKDAVNHIWWLSKTPEPKADNRRVLRPYSTSMRALLQNGYRAKLRPSGHDISTKFARDNKGAIPPNFFDGDVFNLLAIANTESNSKYLVACQNARIKPHPARYPSAVPEFFIRFLTEEGDRVLDPFAGSNVTGEVAEKLGRRWVSFEIVEDYVKGSLFRFEQKQLTLTAQATGRS